MATKVPVNEIGKIEANVRYGNQFNNNLHSCATNALLAHDHILKLRIAWSMLHCTVCKGCDRSKQQRKRNLHFLNVKFVSSKLRYSYTLWKQWEN